MTPDYFRERVALRAIGHFALLAVFLLLAMLLSVCLCPQQGFIDVQRYMEVSNGK